MIKIITICLIILLVACGKSQDEIRAEELANKQQLEAESIKTKKLLQEQEAQNLLKELTTDPDTVKFRNMNGSCGEMNAKNKFGGYDGYRRFYVLSVNDKKQPFLELKHDATERLDEEVVDVMDFAFEQRWLIECEGLKVGKNANLEKCSMDSYRAYAASKIYLEHKSELSVTDIKTVVAAGKDGLERISAIEVVNELNANEQINNQKMTSSPKEFSKNYGLDKFKTCMTL